MVSTTATLRERLAWRHRLAAAAGRAAAAARRVRAWRLTLALPGLAGAALISVGIGLRLGLWAGLIAGGIFALRADSRL
jgi:hypothetical protein